MWGLCYKRIQKVAACEALVAERGLANDTVVNIVQAASEKAQIVHNTQVQAVDPDAIAADKLWSFAKKTSLLSLLA